MEFWEFVKNSFTNIFDIVLLDHRKARVVQFQKLLLTPQVMAFRVIAHPYLTSGYMISRDGALKLVKKSLPISATADWPIDISKLRTFAVAPKIVRQRSLGVTSYLHQERKGVTVDRFRPSLWRYLDHHYWRRKVLKQFSHLIS